MMRPLLVFHNNRRPSDDEGIHLENHPAQPRQPKVKITTEKN